jgi:DNA-binding LacI/PurR family transcriptional regulator
MAVTIRDLAQATGLSIGTISRALKNQGGLTETTRAQVTQVAQQLGYDFGKLRQNRIRRIAFLLHRQHNTLSASPFYSPVLHGAESACRRAGIALSFIALGPAEPIAEQLKLHQPDAIMCVGFFEPEMLAALRTSGKPLVLVDMHVPDYCSVNSDHQLGGYLATRHLLQTGRKRIALLSGSLAHYSISRRARGFRQALFEARVLADPALEICLPDLGQPEQAVPRAMAQLLALPAPPDAVFCYNDSTALAAMAYCQSIGLKVPHDIAIVGFDDISAAAKANPPLSTIRIDKEALGAAGVELLLGTPGDVLEQIQPVQLILRESSHDD